MCGTNLGSKIGRAEPAGDFVTDRNRLEKRATARANRLGDRPSGRDSDDIGMHRAALVNRIEIQRRGVHAVDERGASATDALAARPQGARAQRTLRQDRRARAITAGRGRSRPGNADSIKDAPVRGGDNFRRQVIEAAADDEGR